ncbi:hypothetical protein NDGK_03071 [Clostridiales bacterium CHKCI001]|nr:hypothetical protein NDGK_03071 [Clostridiales bacterium CHKCI001]
MIFLTVGSQKFPFDRLIKKIDELVESGKINQEVFAQIGTATYKPIHILYKEFLSQDEFKQKIEECDIVITHGGTGVIVQAIEKEKKVIAVPRKKEFGEHVDNHQEELIRQFSKMNLILRCDDMEELENCIGSLDEFHPNKYESNTKAYIEELDNYLSHLKKGQKKRYMRNKWRKYIEYLLTKIKILYCQRKFSDCNNTIKYMYERKQSDTIAFVFSSCTRVGVKARYNYVRTVRNFPIDKMFILDDFGSDHRGAFYLGKNMDFSLEKSVLKLIQKTIREGNYKRFLFIGSSKGGYAALNFGMQIPGSIIITGAPQYRLGNYLIDRNNHLEQTLYYITGNRYQNVTENQIQELNVYLENKIDQTSNEDKKPIIYIHYSNKEHTYEEHVRELLTKIKQNGYKVIEDVGEYENHSEISLYFPDFIMSCIREVLTS